MNLIRRQLLKTLPLLLLTCLVPGNGAAAGPSVVASHPRLFFRGGDWDGGRGLTVETIRRRAARPEAAPVLGLLGGSLPNLALRALILAGDPARSMESHAAADSAVAILQQPVELEGTTDQGITLAWHAMAYDWLGRHPAFDEGEKRQAAEEIARAGLALADQLEHGSHIFHTRMYGWAAGVALAGLALQGDHPAAERLIDYGGRYWRERLFPARRLQDGSVHNSFGYGRKYTMWLTGHFISGWHSATGENLWEDIAREQGDWARQELLFNIYGRYPDGTYLRFGDSYSLTSDHYSFRAVSERAQGYRDPVGAGFLRKLLRENAGPVVERPSAYVYFLFFDPEADTLAESALPLRKLFSREGTGMVVWKSGWQEQGTTVFFKCGNYFDDHGHFDQGHLDIFRRAPLLIDSGAYLTFDGPFRREYWHRTVAHNSILILDPALPGDEGGQRVFSSQGDATLGEYLANSRSETGEILDYLDLPGLAYVAGDFTAAYPDDRAERVTRELCFLDDRYLVVLDRVRVKRPDLEPRVLWHCPVPPDREQAVQRFRLDREGGRVLVTTLWPQAAEIAWVDSFQAGGRKIAPEGTLPLQEGMGVGRFEVGDPTGGLEHLFIHAIEITDTPADPNAFEAAPAESSVRFEQGRIRVAVGGREAVFRADSPGLLR